MPPIEWGGDTTFRVYEEVETAEERKAGILKWKEAGEIRRRNRSYSKTVLDDCGDGGVILIVPAMLLDLAIYIKTLLV